MSGWNAYITNLQASSPAIKRAAIIGYPNGEVWARTEGNDPFAATSEELVKFAKAFDDVSKVPATGADLEGKHFIVPRTEEGLIFGKRDKTGFFAMKSKTAVLIAIYEGENAVSAEVRKGVENLTEYLKSSGY